MRRTAFGLLLATALFTGGCGSWHRPVGNEITEGPNVMYIQHYRDVANYEENRLVPCHVGVNNLAWVSKNHIRQAWFFDQGMIKTRTGKTELYDLSRPVETGSNVWAFRPSAVLDH
jgi:hypothetical protein